MRLLLRDVRDMYREVALLHRDSRTAVTSKEGTMTQCMNRVNVFLLYTVPNAQKINSLARNQSRASHIPRASRRQPDFPGSDFLPWPKPGQGSYYLFYTI